MTTLYLAKPPTSSRQRLENKKKYKKTLNYFSSLSLLDPHSLTQMKHNKQWRGTMKQDRRDVVVAMLQQIDHSIFALVYKSDNKSNTCSSLLLLLANVNSIVTSITSLSEFKQITIWAKWFQLESSLSHSSVFLHSQSIGEFMKLGEKTILSSNFQTIPPLLWRFEIEEDKKKRRGRKRKEILKS